MKGKRWQSPKNHPLNPIEVARKMRAAKQIGSSILLIWEGMVILLSFFTKRVPACRQSVWTIIKSILIDTLDPQYIQSATFNRFQDRNNQMMLDSWNAMELRENYRMRYAKGDRIIESCTGDKIDFSKSNLAIAEFYSALRRICLDYIQFVKAPWTESQDDELRKITTTKLCHFLFNSIFEVRVYTPMPNLERLRAQQRPKQVIKANGGPAIAGEASPATTPVVTAEAPSGIGEVHPLAAMLPPPSTDLEGHKWGIDAPPPPPPYDGELTPLGEILAGARSAIPEIQVSTVEPKQNGQPPQPPQDLLLGDHSVADEVATVGSTT